MKIKGLQVKLIEAEKIRKYLSERDLIKKGFKIKKDNEFIYFPVEKIPQELNSYKVIKSKFEKYKTEPKSYKEIISIPDKLKDELPTSYDIIGDIILIKIKDSLLDYKEEIGKSLLKTNNDIKTVCLTKPIKGELRTRDIEIIAGEKNTKTLHKEYGLKFEVDINKTYFSPRLSTERKRIADLVRPGEIVIDMFAGVAPFSIMIAKYAQPKRIYAIDKNKDAVEYARRNVIRNNVLDKVEVIHTDAKKIHNIFNQKKIKANRIIMNLPFSAYLFFEYALDIIANPCVIHYYDILKEENISGRIEELKRKAKKVKITLTNFNIKKIKTYAPREFYMGIDITAKNYADVA